MKKIKKWEKIYHILNFKHWTSGSTGEQSLREGKQMKWPSCLLSSLLDHNTGRTSSTWGDRAANLWGALVLFQGKDQRGELHCRVLETCRRLACFSSWALVNTRMWGKYPRPGNRAMELTQGSHQRDGKTSFAGTKQSSPRVLSLQL